MLKKVSFVVWSAFVVWMVVFLFSFSQADADSLQPIDMNKIVNRYMKVTSPEDFMGDSAYPQSLEIKKITDRYMAMPQIPAPPPAPVLDPQSVAAGIKLKSYVNYICGQFTAYNSCRTPAYKQIEAAVNASAKTPVVADGAKLLEITLQICTAPESAPGSVNGKPNYQRNNCLRAADEGLSDENWGNHPECVRAKHRFGLPSTDAELENELACYYNALKKDLTEAKANSASKASVDPALYANQITAKVLCHAVENFKPSAVLNVMPRELRGIVLKPQGSCQKLEEKWAVEALKKTDDSSQGRSDIEIKYLQYSLIKNMCEDPVEGKKPHFTERCFFGAGMLFMGFNDPARHMRGFSDSVNYSECLTPDVLNMVSEKNPDYDTKYTLAKENSYSGKDQLSAQCFTKAFDEDFEMLTSLRKTATSDDDDLLKDINEHAGVGKANAVK